MQFQRGLLDLQFQRGLLDLRSELTLLVSTVPNLSAFRSICRLQFVRTGTRIQLGNRAFCVAGTVAWDSPPLDIRATRFSLFQPMTVTISCLRAKPAAGGATMSVCGNRL